MRRRAGGAQSPQGWAEPRAAAIRPARPLRPRRAAHGRLGLPSRAARGMDAAGLTLKLLMVGDSAVGKSRC